MKRATEVNPYVGRYQRESQILNPGEYRGGLNMPIMKSDLKGQQGALLEIEGNQSGSHKGEFYNPSRRAGNGSHWHLAVLPALKAELKEVELKFALYKKSQVNSGNAIPTSWPSNLLEDRQILEAKIEVAEAEIAALKALIEPMLKAETEEAEKPLPRRQWGSGQLDDDGILCKIAGWHVSMNPDLQVLCIDDPRSPFNNMEVWKFKSQILAPIQREESYRERQATKEAIKTGQRKVKPKPPATPIFHAATGVIEYPGYSDQVLRKLKQTT